MKIPFSSAVLLQLQRDTGHCMNCEAYNWQQQSIHMSHDHCLLHFAPGWSSSLFRQLSVWIWWREGETLIFSQVRVRKTHSPWTNQKWSDFHLLCAFWRPQSYLQPELSALTLWLTATRFASGSDAGSTCVHFFSELRSFNITGCIWRLWRIFRKLFPNKMVEPRPDQNTYLLTYLTFINSLRGCLLVCLFSLYFHRNSGQSSLFISPPRHERQSAIGREVKCWHCAEQLQGPAGHVRAPDVQTSWTALLHRWMGQSPR